MQRPRLTQRVHHPSAVLCISQCLKLSTTSGRTHTHTQTTKTNQKYTRTYTHTQSQTCMQIQNAHARSHTRTHSQNPAFLIISNPRKQNIFSQIPQNSRSGNTKFRIANLKPIRNSDFPRPQLQFVRGPFRPNTKSLLPQYKSQKNMSLTSAVSIPYSATELIWSGANRTEEDGPELGPPNTTCCSRESSLLLAGRGRDYTYTHAHTYAHPHTYACT